MTAVLRLIEQLEGEDSKIARVIGLKKYNSIIKEALQEEEEQIKDAWDNGCGYVQENSQQYYNETFNNKNNETRKRSWVL